MGKWRDLKKRKRRSRLYRFGRKFDFVKELFRPKDEIYYGSRWSNSWDSFYGDWIDPWMLPIHDYFFPHNVQKIRNTPRSWTDRSERIVHCVFSMLCDFVEREHTHCEGGFRGRIEMLKQQWIKESEKWHGLTPEERSEYPFDPVELAKHHWEREQEILDIYDWYNKVDWDCPDGIDWHTVNVERDFDEIQRKEEAFREMTQKMLHKAIDSRELWWT